jgi:ParB family chromosome partitioning protein
VDQHGANKAQAVKPRALGKGLESLLPSRLRLPQPPSIAAAAESTGKPLEIDVELIDRNPFQTRTNFDEAKLAELAASITRPALCSPSWSATA